MDAADREFFEEVLEIAVALKQTAYYLERALRARLDQELPGQPTERAPSLRVVSGSFGHGAGTDAA